MCAISSLTSTFAISSPDEFLCLLVVFIILNYNHETYALGYRPTVNDRFKCDSACVFR